MKAGTWRTSSVLFCVLASVMIGCTQSQGPSWGTSSGTAFQTIDDAQFSYSTMTVTRDDHVCVVLAAARGTGNHSSGGEGRFHGTIPVVDGVDVQWSCVIDEAQPGTVTINNRRFDLAEGQLFLVTAVHQYVEVKQIKLDAKRLDTLSDAKELFEVLIDNPELSAFRAACRENE
jgi:hypothetical protein